MGNEKLHDIYIGELKDIFSAENQIVKALPKVIRAAASQELKSGLEQHLEETKSQIERLELIFKRHDVSPRGEFCEGMEGLLKECSKAIDEHETGPVRDVALIACCQKVEHYEVSAYGTLRTLAEIMGHSEDAQLFETLVQEEAAADDALTAVAKTVNREAAEISGQVMMEKSKVGAGAGAGRESSGQTQSNGKRSQKLTAKDEVSREYTAAKSDQGLVNNMRKAAASEPKSAEETKTMKSNQNNLKPSANAPTDDRNRDFSTKKEGTVSGTKSEMNKSMTTQKSTNSTQKQTSSSDANKKNPRPPAMAPNDDKANKDYTSQKAGQMPNQANKTTGATSPKGTSQSGQTANSTGQQSKNAGSQSGQQGSQKSDSGKSDKGTPRPSKCAAADNDKEYNAQRNPQANASGNQSSSKSDSGKQSGHQGNQGGPNRDSVTQSGHQGNQGGQNRDSSNQSGQQGNQGSQNRDSDKRTPRPNQFAPADNDKEYNAQRNPEAGAQANQPKGQQTEPKKANAQGQTGNHGNAGDMSRQPSKNPQTPSDQETPKRPSRHAAPDERTNEYSPSKERNMGKDKEDMNRPTPSSTTTQQQGNMPKPGPETSPTTPQSNPQAPRPSAHAAPNDSQNQNYLPTEENLPGNPNTQRDPNRPTPTTNPPQRPERATPRDPHQPLSPTERQDPAYREAEVPDQNTPSNQPR